MKEHFLLKFTLEFRQHFTDPKRTWLRLKIFLSKGPTMQEFSYDDAGAIDRSKVEWFASKYEPEVIFIGLWKNLMEGPRITDLGTIFPLSSEIFSCGRS